VEYIVIRVTTLVIVFNVKFFFRIMLVFVYHARHIVRNVLLDQKPVQFANWDINFRMEVVKLAPKIVKIVIKMGVQLDRTGLTFYPMVQLYLALQIVRHVLIQSVQYVNHLIMSIQIILVVNVLQSAVCVQIHQFVQIAKQDIIFQQN
jgi:hypothetical protein